jgi:hypothetical protein
LAITDGHCLANRTVKFSLGISDCAIKRIAMRGN